MEKLLIIDGNSIINRAYYGIHTPLSTKDGFPTNALYGMVKIIEKQFEYVKPNYVYVAFDVKAPTFRHNNYEFYKAGRHPTPDDLLKQIPVAHQLCEFLGFKVLELAGYEADDILGTVTYLAGLQGIESYILTGDRDSLQLINNHTHVLLISKDGTNDYTEKEFYEKYGITPKEYIDVKALMGDSSDNIPGVPGIGEKTAFKLIADYHSLEQVYEQLDTLSVSQSVKDKLLSGKESALLSQFLATICLSVPLNISFENDRYIGVNHEYLYNFCIEYDFISVLNKSVFKPIIDKKIQKTTKFNMMENAGNAILNIPDTVLSLEYSNEQFVISDGQNIWTLDNDYLKDFLFQHSHLIVYDAKNIYELLHNMGITWFNAEYDVMLEGYVLQSNVGNYDFPSLIDKYLCFTFDNSIPKVILIFQLHEIMYKELQSTEQTELFKTIEMPLAKVLAKMELSGIKVDTEGLNTFSNQISISISCLESDIYAMAGVQFNINSPKQLGEILFDKLQLPVVKKKKNGYSTNAEILEKIKPYHPIIQKILDYRQLTKIKATYCDGLLLMADKYGYIHSNFKQTGTATGRLSSAEPNLQNIPIRTELGRELRRYFIPHSEDYVLIDADYSQIELRLLADISKDPYMIAAFNSGEDIHTSTASLVFGLPMEQVTSDLRKKAKAVNFGIIYGISDFSLADDLHITKAQAKDFIERYFKSYPLISDYMNVIVDSAYKIGYVTTMFKRRRYIPEIQSSNKNLQHFGERVAMNSPIQGTAADLIKKAMIQVDRRLEEEGIDARLILQVHDELIVEAHKNCKEKAYSILKNEMEQVAQLDVPLDVDIHMGNTWFETK